MRIAMETRVQRSLGRVGLARQPPHCPESVCKCWLPQTELSRQHKLCQLCEQLINTRLCVICVTYCLLAIQRAKEVAKKIIRENTFRDFIEKNLQSSNSRSRVPRGLV